MRYCVVHTLLALARLAHATSGTRIGHHAGSRKTAFFQAIGYAQALMPGGGNWVKPFRVHVQQATTSIQVDPSYPFPVELGKACNEWSRQCGDRKSGNANKTKIAKRLQTGVRYVCKVEGAGLKEDPPLMGNCAQNGWQAVWFCRARGIWHGRSQAFPRGSPGFSQISRLDVCTSRAPVRLRFSTR